MHTTTERRAFLKYLGAGFAGAAAHAAGPLGPIVHAGGPMPFQRGDYRHPGLDVPVVRADRPDRPRRPGAAAGLPLPDGARLRRPLHLVGRALRLQRRLHGVHPAQRRRHRRAARGSTTSTSARPTDNYGQAFTAAVGGVPTVQDMKFDVGGQRRRPLPVVGRQLVRAPEQRAQPPHHRRLAGDRRRSGAAGRLERRRHARQLLGLPHAVGHGAHLRGELPGLRARESRDRRPGHGRRPVQQERHALRLGGRGRSARSELDPGEAHLARPLPPRERRAPHRAVGGR